MAKNTVALAAILLACGVGATSAQEQIQTPMPGQTQGRVQEPMPPLYRQHVPDTAPLGPHVDNPRVNPSAAGTLMRRDAHERPGTPGETAGQTGSQEITPLTHPVEAWRARRQMQEDRAVPLGTTPVPHPTMQPQDGR
jgi:hypothetical protein